LRQSKIVRDSYNQVQSHRLPKPNHTSIRYYSKEIFHFNLNPNSFDGSDMNENRKGNALIIDDDPMNNKLLRTVLESKGNYIVHDTVDAVEGFKKAYDCRPDVILMETQMPGMDGLSMIWIIKSESSLKDIPIVAVSANAMDGDKEKALAAGCCGYITKPIDVRNFVDAMEQFM
jgi:two-component system cell cycle response regulator DivK